MDYAKMEHQSYIWKQDYKDLFFLFYLIPPYKNKFAFDFMNEFQKYLFNRVLSNNLPPSKIISSYSRESFYTIVGMVLMKAFPK